MALLSRTSGSAAVSPPSKVPYGYLGRPYKVAIFAYVLAVVLFSYREGLTWPAKVAAVLLLGCFVLKYVVGGDRLIFPVPYKLLGAWFFVGIIASAISPELDASVPRILTLAQLFPVAFIVSNLIYRNGSAAFYWVILGVAAIASGVVTLLDPYRFSTIDGRLFGTLGNANTFAVLLVAGVAVSLAGFSGARAIWLKVACGAGGAFFLYLVVGTGSRTGMLASLVVVAISAWRYRLAGTTSRAGVGRTLSWVLVATALVGVSLYVVTSSEFVQRLSNLFSALENKDFGSVGDNSLKARSMLYVKAFELFLDSPLIGVGLDVFATAGIDYRRIGNNSHSNYMEILSSTGLVGALLYFAIYAHLWRRLLVMAKVLRGGQYDARVTLVMALSAAFIVIDLSFVTYYAKVTWVIFAGVIAELSLLERAARVPAAPVRSAA
jgi:O-antigen ligase